MHKIQGNQQGFAEGDDQSHDGVEPSEVDKGDPIGRICQDQQYDKNSEIDFWRDNLFRHAAHLLRALLSDTVVEREKSRRYLRSASTDRLPRSVYSTRVRTGH